MIGLTGRNGSGKGTVAEILKKRGFVYHSLSDAIRDELRDQDQEITRTSLIAKGRELRESGGPGILAEKILKKISSNQNHIVDSIRNPHEVHALKKRDDFFLLCIEADQKLRFERCKARQRENDPQEFAEFVRLEEQELQSQHKAGQQLLATEELADFIVNNSGSIEKLEAEIEAAMQEILHTKE